MPSPKQKILVIEDDLGLAKGLQENFASAGFEATCVTAMQRSRLHGSSLLIWLCSISCCPEKAASSCVKACGKLAAAPREPGNDGCQVVRVDELWHVDLKPSQQRQVCVLLLDERG
jgi:hypothetical protein